MNSVILIGNLVRDPEVRYANEKPIANFTLALPRGKDRNGSDLGADYPKVVCFGKTAEVAEKFLKKGRKVAVTGRINTGSYEKDGKKIYTTDVLCEKLEFLDTAKKDDDPVQGFASMDESDLPF